MKQNKEQDKEKQDRFQSVTGSDSSLLIYTRCRNANLGLEEATDEWHSRMEHGKYRRRDRMTLREALSQPSYPEDTFANAWYFCSDGRVYCVIHMKKAEVHPSEKEGYYLYSYPAHYQPSKTLEMLNELGNRYSQTFRELENAVSHEHFLKIDDWWDPNMNPFSDME